MREIDGSETRSPEADRVHLVIFDCDGVLVESEEISSRVLAELLEELGVRVSPAEVSARFLGRRIGDIAAEVETEVRQDLGEPWIHEFEERRAKVFEAELSAVPGARQVLSALRAREVPLCVASQARSAATWRKLVCAGLSDLIPKGTVFSADEVAYGKPHPAVFLHAARAMGVEPDRCIVVEDSPDGVTAALRAGMRVFHYTKNPDADHRSSWKLSSLAEIPSRLGIA